MAIEIEMIVAAAAVGLAHRALEFTRAFFADEGVVAIATEGPGVVLRSAEVDLVKAGGPLAAKERVVQL